MPFGPQAEREWLEPLNERGNRNEEHPDYGEVVGCHVGRHRWLNIYGALPGYTYIWERNTAADKRGALLKGGQIVKDDDPEMVASRFASGEDDLAVSVDSTAEYRELVLVRYSDKAMRQIREAEQRKARNYMIGGTEDFISGQRAQEQNDIHNPRGVRTRFATSEHRTEFRGSRSRVGDTVNDQWTPDRGIIED